MSPHTSRKSLISEGMKPHGLGFLVDLPSANALGLGRIPGIEHIIRPYLNGRDLTSISRGIFIIDAFDYSAESLAERFPSIYQHLIDYVKPEREQKAHSVDGRQYAVQWWLFGKTRKELRRGLHGLERYIITVKTAKFRNFQFLPIAALPDSKLIAIASDDALHLGILSSRIHIIWSTITGSRLGVGDDPTYVISKSFAAFPFPTPTAAQAARIRDLAEQLDAHRKRQQADHPDLTLTGIYNVLVKLRTGAVLTVKEQVIHANGLVAVLRQLHDDLDAAVAAAYGWPVDLPDAELLTRLVALNAKRAAEEKAGTVRWLRPAFQAPDEVKAIKHSWPKAVGERLALLREVLHSGGTIGLTVEAVRKRIAGAKAADVAELLSALEAMGHARSIEGNWLDMRN